MDFITPVFESIYLKYPLKMWTLTILKTIVPKIINTD